MKTFKDDIGFTEGPVVCQDGSIAVTSIDRGVVYRIAEGEANVLGRTGGGPNGAVEGEDAFYVTQNGGIWPSLDTVTAKPGVQRVSRDGAVAALIGEMVAPNDLAFGPDGLLYVTDPTRKPERNDGRIWRVDTRAGKGEVILHCDWYPNGIGFSLDDDWIYIADTGRRRLVRVPIDAPAPDAVETVFEMSVGMPDGFAFDVDGNCVVAAVGVEEGDQGTVQVWSREGKLLEMIEPRQSRFITNLAISPERILYVCDSGNSRLLSMEWPAPGLPLHPFRT